MTEALDGLADKTVRSHVDLVRPVTMLIGQVPYLAAIEVVCLSATLL
jgi:hypothetical protein